MGQKRVIDRLTDYMVFRGINDNRLSIESGLSLGLLANARKGSGDISHTTVNKILSAFPEINRQWLLTGDGNMIVEGNQSVVKSSAIVGGNGNATIGLNADDVSSLIRQNEKLIDTIRELIKK